MSKRSWKRFAGAVLLWIVMGVFVSLAPYVAGALPMEALEFGFAVSSFAVVVASATWLAIDWITGD